MSAILAYFYQGLELAALGFRHAPILLWKLPFLDSIPALANSAHSLMGQNRPPIDAPFADGIIGAIQAGVICCRGNVPDLEPMIDPVTRLPNGVTLRQRIEDEIARARRYGGLLSLLLADISGGDAGGGGESADEVLCRFALLLLSSAREGDVAARVGGGRFALLLPDTDGPGAAAAAHRLWEASAAMDAGDAPLPLRLGVATWTPEMADGMALIERAESVLTEADTSEGVVPGE